MPKKKKKELGSSMGLDEGMGVMDDESEIPVPKKNPISSADSDDDDIEKAVEDDEDDLLVAGDDDEEEEVN